MMAERASSLLGTTQSVVLVGGLLNHLPKFSGLNVPLQHWKERLEGADRLCIVGPQIKVELALSTLAGGARKTVMLQPAHWLESFEQILSLLEDVYGDVSSEAILRKRFFD